MIIIIAPIGVFALITKTITTLTVGDDGQADLSQIGSILGALGYYCIAVIIGLLLHITIVYIGILKFFTSINISRFSCVSSLNENTATNNQYKLSDSINNNPIGCI